MSPVAQADSLTLSSGVACDNSGLTFWQNPVLFSADPFDALAVQMPFRSHALLRHFHRTVQAAVTSSALGGPCSKLTIHDSSSLRNVLLVASLHYTWQTGSFGSIEPTHLFHKLESIRMINRWIGDGDRNDRIVDCSRHILTLVFVEANAVDRAYSAIGGHKGRLHDAAASSTTSGDSPESLRPENVEDLMQKWASPRLALELRLNGLSMVPFFFTSHMGHMSRLVDIRPVLTCLQHITYKCDMRSPVPSINRFAEGRSELWSSNGPAQLVQRLVKTHIQSLGRDVVLDNLALPSSWSGFAVAMSLYLTSVLGVWNGGMPPEPSLLRRMVSVLETDLRTSQMGLAKKRPEAQALWAWKAYVGFISLQNADRSAPGHGLQATSLVSDACLKPWAEATGNTTWTQARRALYLT
ncbi:hypothetical protein FDECE_702 [Fusarium decemcellulare]|nr:hypothetical protein FDECE_702 [Fusarium decemcellulare]